MTIDHTCKSSENVGDLDKHGTHVTGTSHFWYLKKP